MEQRNHETYYQCWLMCPHILIENGLCRCIFSLPGLSRSLKQHKTNTNTFFSIVSFWRGSLNSLSFLPFVGLSITASTLSSSWKIEEGGKDPAWPKHAQKARVSIYKQTKNVLFLYSIWLEERWRGQARVCPPFRLSACPPVRLSACPQVRLSACLSA